MHFSSHSGHACRGQHTTAQLLKYDCSSTNPVSYPTTIEYMTVNTCGSKYPSLHARQQHAGASHQNAYQAHECHVCICYTPALTTSGGGVQDWATHMLACLLGNKFAACQNSCCGQEIAIMSTQQLPQRQLKQLDAACTMLTRFWTILTTTSVAMTSHLHSCGCPHH